MSESFIIDMNTNDEAKANSNANSDAGVSVGVRRSDVDTDIGIGIDIDIDIGFSSEGKRTQNTSTSDSKLAAPMPHFQAPSDSSYTTVAIQNSDCHSSSSSSILSAFVSSTVRTGKDNVASESNGGLISGQMADDTISELCAAVSAQHMHAQHPPQHHTDTDITSTLSPLSVLPSEAPPSSSSTATTTASSSSCAEKKDVCGKEEKHNYAIAPSQLPIHLTWPAHPAHYERLASLSAGVLPASMPPLPSVYAFSPMSVGLTLSPSQSLALPLSTISLLSSSSAGQRFFSRDAPGEILVQVCSFLDTNSLAHLSSVSLRSHCVAGDRSLWSVVLSKDFYDSLPRWQPRDEYRRRKELIVKQAELRRLEVKQHAVEIRLKRVSSAFHCFVEPCMPFLVSVFCFLAIVLISVELNQNQNEPDDPTSTHITMWSAWPLIALVGYGITNFCIVALSRWKLLPCLHYSFFNESQSLARALIEEFDEAGSQRWVPGLCVWAIFFVVFIVLLSLKLVGAISASYSLVFIPVWCFFGWTMLAPICRPRIQLHDFIGFWTASWIVLWGPLFAFAVLVLLQLDSDSASSLSMAKILAPLFCVDAFILCMFVAVSLLEKIGPLLALPTYFLSFFLLLIFKVLLVLYYDQRNPHLDYIKVFAPLYVFSANLLIAGTLLMIALTHEARFRWGVNS